MTAGSAAAEAAAPAPTGSVVPAVSTSVCTSRFACSLLLTIPSVASLYVGALSGRISRASCGRMVEHVRARVYRLCTAGGVGGKNRAPHPAPRAFRAAATRARSNDLSSNFTCQWNSVADCPRIRTWIVAFLFGLNFSAQSATKHNTLCSTRARASACTIVPGTY